ncbi:MAG: protein kinase [Phycisphaeraceae bacterium]|nr:protein kinase [Phycisphaeraceae bacterium]MCB9848169.1 protein kinase [Phycisphaeraceae bacterium]
MPKEEASRYGRPWTEAEFLAVLDAYLRHRGEPNHRDVSWVGELAALLGRSPAAVVMRLENYAAVDPAVDDRRGLDKGGRRCRDIYVEWHEKPDALRDLARIHLDHVRAARLPNLFEDEVVPIPRAFGKYELMDPLGEGGFGAVYSCLDTATGEQRAIKVIQRSRIPDPEAFPRLRREIRLLRKVHHTNVIRLFDDSLDDDRSDPAYVMELARCSLASYLAEREAEGRASGGQIRPALDHTESTNIICCVLSAVCALHGEHRIIHRDITPANVFLKNDSSEWMLADFGLAKLIATISHGQSFITRASQGGFGTEHYAAPEQWGQFADCDERVDIYSIGVLIWALFTTEYPPKQSSHLGIPGPLEALVHKATAHHAADRHGDIAELTDAFEEAVRTGW